MNRRQFLGIAGGAALALVALGYLLGVGTETAAADPYAGLLGGAGGGF